jgi:DNA modification methylase
MKTSEPKFRNQLYYGDNLDIIRRYVNDETVDLCYIDPPFNSKRNYNQIYMNVGHEDTAQAQAFVDTWTWSGRSNNEIDELIENKIGLYTAQTIKLISGLEKVLTRGSMLSYLISMTLRIAEIHRVLKKTGSFYLHCDPTMSHYLKLVCDSIFCPPGGDFINEIIWCYKSRHFSKTHFGRKHDILFYYSKSDKYTFNWTSILRPLSPVTIKKFKLKDDIGYYRLCGRGIKGSPIKSAKDIDPKWEITNPELVVRDYLKEGVPIEDYWYIEILNQSAKERLGYPTQKPEELLEKIISASTDKGDVVLDAYCGCGTTIAVAQKLKRKWIGIDITYHSISLMMKRLEDSFNKTVMDNLELTGVPKDFESAEALANKDDDRVRKEFEKWAVLTYSNNRAVINEKKGKDFGIDGIAFISDRINNEIEQMPIIFSVKSDKHPKPSYVCDLIGVMQREKAVLGYFISLYPPTKDMIDEALKQGKYKNDLLGLEYSKVKIVTIQEILDGKQMRLPKSLTREVLKSAPKIVEEAQMQLELPD